MKFEGGRISPCSNQSRRAEGFDVGDVVLSSHNDLGKFERTSSLRRTCGLTVALMQTIIAHQPPTRSNCNPQNQIHEAQQNSTSPTSPLQPHSPRASLINPLPQRTHDIRIHQAKSPANRPKQSYKQERDDTRDDLVREGRV
jgi:hypothetical protein